MAFLHIKCNLAVGYVPFNNSLLLFFQFLLLQLKGRDRSMGPCSLSYDGDNNVAMLCQQVAKARERNDRAGGGCACVCVCGGGGGCPPPTVGRFLKFRVSKCFFFFKLNVIFGVGYCEGA